MGLINHLITGGPHIVSLWGTPKSSSRHPVVMDDHNFVLKHIETHGDDWGFPILRNPGLSKPD